MTEHRLRWLSRGQARSHSEEPGVGGSAIPFWVEWLLDLGVRAGPEQLDWTEVARITCQVLSAQIARIWRMTARSELVLQAQAGDGQEAPSSPRPIPTGFDRLAPGKLAVGPLDGPLAESFLTAEERVALRRSGVQHVLVAPLHAGGTTVGRLDVARTRPEPFSAEDRSRAVVLAELVGLLVGRVATVGEPLPSDQAAELVHQALALPGSAREVLARIVEALRWRVRASAVLFLRWLPEERVELLTTSTAPELMPDPTALTSSRVLMLVRNVLEQGRPQRWRAGSGSELIFPVVMAETLAFPLPVIGTAARGVLVLAWRDRDEGGEERAQVLVPELAPRLLTLVGFVEREERAIAARASMERRELLLDALLRTSGPTVIAEALWRRAQSVSGVVAAGVLLEGDERFVWFWVVQEEPRVLVETDRERSPAQLALSQRPVAVFGPDRWATWQAVVPLELEQAWVVTAPLGTVRGGLVIVTHEEQATAEAERLVTDLVSLLEARADALVTRLDRDLAEMRRQRALGDALVQHAEEWRTLVDAIHTTVLQGLASSLYRIELTTRRVNQQPVEQTLLELEQVRDILASHIAALRDAIFRQRPASLEHLGLAAALRDYAAQLQRAHALDVDFLGELWQRPDPHVEESLFGLVRLLVERTRLPLGVRKLVIRLRQRTDSTIVLVVADDAHWAGRAAWEELPGAALASEWVRLLGGTLHVAGLPDGGTAIACTVPLRRAL